MTDGAPYFSCIFHSEKLLFNKLFFKLELFLKPKSVKRNGLAELKVVNQKVAYVSVRRKLHLCHHPLLVQNERLKLAGVAVANGLFGV